MPPSDHASWGEGGGEGSVGRATDRPLTGRPPVVVPSDGTVGRSVRPGYSSWSLPFPPPLMGDQCGEPLGADRPEPRKDPAPGAHTPGRARREFPYNQTNRDWGGAKTYGINSDGIGCVALIPPSGIFSPFYTCVTSI